MSRFVRPLTDLDFRNIAGNLLLSETGVWTSPEHKDLKFLQNDETDWLAIERGSFWYHHRNRCFAEFLRRFPPAGILFEIGAGNGSVALALQNAGHAVAALEPTVKLADQAKFRGLRHVICSTLEGARFRDGTLPNIGIFDVLEHIRDDETYLSKIRRLISTSGRLYCAVPAWQLLWSREDDVAEHFRRYTLRELCLKIGRAGFNVEYSTYYFAPLVIPILLLRALPSWLRIRPQRTHASSAREHLIQRGTASSILESALRWELGRFSRGKTCRFGASCFVIAQAR